MALGIISYLKFLLKSTNEHGVHSPFVFNYVTQCLYSKKKRHKNKSIDVLLKSMAYFNFKNIHVADNPKVQEIVQLQFPDSNSASDIFDIFFADHLNEDEFKKILSEGKIHNDSMILVDSIHSSKEKREAWNQLALLPEISVSIDMYYCGVIFIRKEQVKEHFTIRI